MSTPDCKAMLERDHSTRSIRGQCRLLGIARSGVYRPDPSNDDEDPALMRRMGIAALGPKPKTSKPAPESPCRSTFTTAERPHQALGNRTPMAVWREGVTGRAGR